MLLDPECLSGRSRYRGLVPGSPGRRRCSIIVALKYPRVYYTYAMSAKPAAETGASTQNAAAALMMEYTAEELRRMAAHLDDVSRSRGATKSQTAEQIAEQTEADLAGMMGPGRATVKCSCGLRLSGCHPQTARREAQAHKSANPSHFPKARDSEDNSRIYG